MLLDAQQKVISKIALGDSLERTLNCICHAIERMFVKTKGMSSILVLKGDQLFHGAAPSLPKEYCEHVNGVVIGPRVGSCGTSAFTKQRYIAEDIETDISWQAFKTLALPHQLLACWSTPIMSSQGEVLGTFAVYYDHPREPQGEELEVIDLFTHLTGLAIEKHQASEREALLNTELHLSHRKIQALTGVMPDAAMVFDGEGVCVDAYGGQEPISKPLAQIKGRLITDVFTMQYRWCSALEAVESALDADQLQIFEYELGTDERATYFEGRLLLIEAYLPENPEKKHVLWVAREITDRKQAEKKIQQLAYYDPLTRLPNRRFLLDRLKKLISQVGFEDSLSALLYIDLDNFKGINDTLGHSAGDSLLEDIAKRINRSDFRVDTISRIGGDEFVILLKSFFEPESKVMNHAVSVAERLMAELDSPFIHDHREFRVGASIGIAMIKNDDIHPDEILIRADTAMYAAKRSDETGYCFYDPALHNKLLNQFEIENDIKQAISHREIMTYFQPQIDKSGQLTGFESLVRWQHPNKGFIAPEEIVKAAENIGYIAELQRIVLEDSCALYSQLQDVDNIPESLTFAINISPAHFNTQRLCEESVEVLQRFDIDPAVITIELTESMLIEDTVDVEERMQELKDRGFRLSIDDFGTGYSSLAYLQRFPIDEIKIDKSFVDHILDEKVGDGIVQTILSMAKHFDFDVVVEGVEHLEQVNYLQDCNITSMQGFYFARPMDAEHLMEWILDNSLTRVS